MAIVAMNTSNPLGVRPFGAMGGMNGTWDLMEQDRSWIVRDTASAPTEHMRIPPELLSGLGATIPGKVFLYREGPAPFLLDGTGPQLQSMIRVGPAPAVAPVVENIGSVEPIVTSVSSLLTPGGSTPPVVPTVQHQELSFMQIVPQGSPIVAIGPGSSTQNLVPVSMAAQQAAPGLTSILASGQPASSAQPIDTSWFTDPAQEVIGGVPNWGMFLVVTALAMYSSKGKR